jgi:AcrR family transcriptional regulator
LKEYGDWGKFAIRIFFRNIQATMTTRRIPQISARKQPRQARSTALVAAILEAAIQVLAKEGAQRFTSARVAEKAGVSVGSIYQYFPNKAAILFRLQSDEWLRTAKMLQSILEDARKPPLERLRALVHAFIRSECEEAEIRTALSDAAPLYRNAPEVQAAKVFVDKIFLPFMREVLPKASKKTLALTVDLITTTLDAIGKNFSGSAHTPAEIRAYANAVADMFCAYLAELGRQPV